VNRRISEPIVRRRDSHEFSGDHVIDVQTQTGNCWTSQILSLYIHPPRRILCNSRTPSVPWPLVPWAPCIDVIYVFTMWCFRQLVAAPAFNVNQAANHVSWSALLTSLFSQHSSSSTCRLFYQPFCEQPVPPCNTNSSSLPVLECKSVAKFGVGVICRWGVIGWTYPSIEHILCWG